MTTERQTNGSNRIVWAWAGVTTALVLTLIVTILNMWSADIREKNATIVQNQRDITALQRDVANLKEALDRANQRNGQ
jgi:outer membrane murein-binding lipoprotein Lpp